MHSKADIFYQTSGIFQLLSNPIRPQALIVKRDCVVFTQAPPDAPRKRGTVRVITRLPPKRAPYLPGTFISLRRFIESTSPVV